MDPLVQTISADGFFDVEFLNAVDIIMTRFKGAHTICGLSNISQGLPERKFLNRTLMVMAITKGLDGAIVDPLDKQMMVSIIAAEALAGKDDYCGGYPQAYRAKTSEL